MQREAVVSAFRAGRRPASEMVAGRAAGADLAKPARSVMTPIARDILTFLTVWALVAAVIYGLVLLYPLV